MTSTLLYETGAMKKFMITLILLICAIAGFSQNSRHQKKLHRKADKYFKHLAYEAAAYNYKELVNTNPKDILARERLAMCYKELNFQETSRGRIRKSPYLIASVENQD